MSEEHKGKYSEQCVAALFDGERRLSVIPYDNLYKGDVLVKIREMLLQHYDVRQVALMSDDDILDALQVHYAFVSELEYGDPVLVPRNRLDEYRKLVIELKGGDDDERQR